MIPELNLSLLFAEQRNDFVMHDLDKHLARFNRVEHIGASCLVTDIVQKVLYNPVVNIRFQECKPHFLEHILHVGIGKLSLTDNIPHGFIQTIT